MGLLPHLCSAAANLFVIAIDVAILLTLVRLVQLWRPDGVLGAIDCIGAPVVNYVTDLVDRVQAMGGVPQLLPIRGKLVTAIGLMLVVRVVITSLCMVFGLK